MTMTYRQYIALCQRKQRAYIRSERVRYKKALKLWDDFNRKMGLLNLHPLNSQEIFDRFRELDRMERDVPSTHGDTPAMRALYEARKDEAAA